MTLEAPGLIEAIGDLWRLVAVGGVVIVLILFRRPLSDLVDRTRHVRVQRGGTQLVVEGSDERAPSPPASEQEAPPEASDDPTTQPTGDKTEDDPGWRMMVAMFQGRRGDAAAALAELQESATSEAEKKRHEVTYLGLAYRFDGDTAALQRLDELSRDPDVRFEATRTRASSLEASGEYGSAATLYKEAAELVPPGKAHGETLVSAARALSEDGRQQEGVALLTMALELSGSSEERASILVGLGELYGAQGNNLMKAVVLEEANSLAPGSPNTLFGLAYAYSEAGFARLALFHYDKLVTLQHLNDMAWNNYGVVLDQIGFPGRSADAYRTASGLSNTLAMANLANRLLVGGFFDEAKAVLESARSQEEVHPNVGLSMSSLDEARKSEMNQLDALLHEVRNEQQFVKEFATVQLAAEKTPDGTATFVASGIDLVVSSQAIFGTWLRGTSQFAVAQPFPIRAADVRLSKRPATRQDANFEPTGSMLVLASQELSSVRVMWPDGTIQSVEASAEA